MTDRSWIANRMDLDVNVVLSSPTWPTILDIVGDLLTNRCQSRSSCFIDRVFCRFGKLPKPCRFVPKAISAINATRTMVEGSDGRPRQATLDPRSAPERY